MIQKDEFEYYNVIYSDKQHYELLQQIMQLQKKDFIKIKEKIVVLEDEYSALVRIDSLNSAIILHYNLSSIIRLERTELLKSVKLFYEQNDRVIELLGESKEEYVSLLESYEVSTNKSIESFFN